MLSGDLESDKYSWDTGRETEDPLKVSEKEMLLNIKLYSIFSIFIFYDVSEAVSASVILPFMLFDGGRICTLARISWTVHSSGHGSSNEPNWTENFPFWWLMTEADSTSESS
jgi:hypothetical protein